MKATILDTHLIVVVDVVAIAVTAAAVALCVVKASFSQAIVLQVPVKDKFLYYYPGKLVNS